ncbi:MAG: peptide chain release factor N(5)-glutamine methyltransferase [Clostridia bacterium]|nr:peptide chain release factor N(5)-glutamine methyltransferase [Clostridia bacterium]
MTIGERLNQTRQTLEANGIPDPETDSVLLLSFVTGLDHLALRLEKNRPMTPEQEQRLASLLLSRTQRQPLQYLLGEQWFYGRRFSVDHRVLIPRQETESLCQLGINRLKGLPSPTVLDMCTGSGAIAVTLKKECPKAQVSAADLSHDALAIARKNAADNQASVTFYQGDLFAAIPAGMCFDLILSNPPYIPSEDCKTLQAEVMQEPVMALDGGDDGLDFYRRLAAESPAYLRADGWLMVEIGSQQARDVSALFAEAGFSDVKVHQDLYGLDRIVAGRRSHV